jgi:hypothetical protein
MAFQGYRVFLGLLVFLGSLIDNSIAVAPSLNNTASLNRSSFPAGFIFGTASAAYQVINSWVNCIIIKFFFKFLEMSSEFGFEIPV